MLGGWGGISSPYNYGIIMYPLSAVKNMNVFSSTPASLSACMTWPTPQSSSARASPNGPRAVVLVKFLPAN